MYRMGGNFAGGKFPAIQAYLENFAGSNSTFQSSATHEKREIDRNFLPVRYTSICIASAFVIRSESPPCYSQSGVEGMVVT